MRARNITLHWATHMYHGERFNSWTHLVGAVLALAGAIVGSRLGPHASVVANSPDIENERIWIVNDLGKRNPELMRVAGNRVPLAFYEDGQRIEVDRSLLAPK